MSFTKQNEVRFKLYLLPVTSIAILQQYSKLNRIKLNGKTLKKTHQNTLFAITGVL